MFHHFALCESKQIIEGGMVAAVVALAEAKHKVPLCKNTMDAMIVDASAALILGRPVHHDVARLVWPMSFLDIVPVLDCLSRCFLVMPESGLSLSES